MMERSTRFPRPVCLTIGVFDGVHRGHQHLFRTMLGHAASQGLAPACVTFEPDPEAVLFPDRPPPMLSTVEERVELIRALGVEHIEVLQFTETLARLQPEQFLAEMGTRFDLRLLCIGSDFALGRERAGTVDVLRQLGRQMGFTVEPVELLMRGDRPISSTWIRELLAAGDVSGAGDLLGRAYCLEGVVETGMQRGRQLGFPTANVRPPPGRALPADGVYFVQATRIDSAAESNTVPWSGVVNLGARPTFDETERLIETHLLDFSGDLYGAILRVCFLRQLRGIQKFAGIDELRAQIARDVEAARELARETDANHPLSPSGADS
jgi:riboflavin kinase/FMN adenylyltransferase